jgi:hypothetical protein
MYMRLFLLEEKSSEPDLCNIEHVVDLLLGTISFPLG